MLLIAVIIFIGYRIYSFGQEQILKIKYATYPLKYMDVVEKYAAEYDMDKYLLLSFIKTESGFDPLAQSGAGAIGLTQITEETFAWIKLKLCPNEDVAFEDLYDPETSIRFGAYYISRCMERYGNDIDTAAAAYHSGWGTVDKLLEESGGEYLTEFPYTQMNNYVYKINKAYTAYTQLYNNQTEGD